MSSFKADNEVYCLKAIACALTQSVTSYVNMAPVCATVAAAVL